MSRPKNLIPTHRLVVYIPEDVYARALIDLYSDVHGRVPLGRWSDTVTALLRDALSKTTTKEAPRG